MEGTPEVDSRFTGLEIGSSGNRPADVDGRRRREPFWHREFWDRYIRDEEHYYDTIEYIHNNPVKARLVWKPEDWIWSSAEGSGSEYIW